MTTPVRLRLRVAAALALSVGTVLSAHAACEAPIPPDAASRPVRPALPEKGACVGAPLGTPNCLGWETQRYNDEIRAFNERAAAWKSAADSYVASLNAYVKASADYARCEVQALN